jgi:conjugal transfer pilin signal peptidase TrbI
VINTPEALFRTRVLPRLAFLVNAPKRELVKAGVVVGALGLFGLMFNTQFGVFLDLNETRCMPERLYVGFPRTETLKHGDIVSFRADNRMMFDLMTGNRVAKIVAGLPGDHVVSNAQGAFVNGVPVGQRNPISLQKLADKGKVPVNMDRVLQPGELFVVGTLPRSFDSRYWGVMPEARVDRLVKAII